jgi:hypothetical protein
VLLGDLSGEQLKCQRAEDGGQKEVIAEGSEELSREKQRVIAMGVHGEAGMDRRTAYRNVVREG